MAINRGESEHLGRGWGVRSWVGEYLAVYSSLANCRRQNFLERLKLQSIFLLQAWRKISFVFSVCLFFPFPYRVKLGHGLLSGQYSKPPVKSELIEQVMKEEHKVFD